MQVYQRLKFIEYYCSIFFFSNIELIFYVKIIIVIWFNYTWWISKNTKINWIQNEEICLKRVIAPIDENQSVTWDLK